ncbi:proteasome activator complex subunit 3 [Anopheles stephensi]|uniref:Proteasome activator PA28 C-terminal domain-containing protein n=1 Tax=Anopheles stephensi TaxID=30069 RepID=A0A182YR81_ANOST|nr:proteasome activator complex subunit 3 [Anopheles stephensi]XP_035894215.1 proteasome activator complex subunit 3 [Anopheles stephensi]
MSESTSTATTSAASSAEDNARKVQQYKDNLISRAETLIVKEFPERIVRLNALLETPQFSERSFTDVYQELNIPVPEPIVLDVEGHAKRPRLNSTAPTSPIDGNGTKVHALPSGHVECNKPIGELVCIVKPIIRALVEDSNLLKMWISFMIPKIEDGNNFGVSIQEDTLAEIQSVETEAAAFFDQISRYFLSRAKVVSKVAKYPHIDDYRRAVAELDEKEFLSLWLVLSEIRNRYCSLHDIVIKNMEKLKKPRSSNADSLY